MSTISDEQVLNYVSENIGTFHESRLVRLNELTLEKLVTRKNPYLYKSKNIVTASGLVQAMLDAFLSSQEEELFGKFLEGLAIYVATEAVSGWKSSATGIDLEFAKGGARYIVSVKSGPNWGNSGQHADMRQSFRNASQLIRQGNPAINVVAVNGCCYGRDEKPDKGTHFKICGQDFWALISGDRDLYTRIIEPLGHDAKQRNDDFMRNYGAVVNRFTLEFMQRFCDDVSAIDWDALVRYCSATTPLLPLPAQKRTVNRLAGVTNICDVLQQWKYPDLASRVATLAGNDPPLNLGSLRGFLMMLGTIQTDATVNLTATPEGLIIAVWQFADHRRTEITFQDVDRVTADAGDPDGKPIRIRRPKTGYNRRRTIERILVEQGLFALRQAD